MIPAAHVEDAHNLEEIGCSLDVDGGPGMGQTGVFGEASGRPMPVAVENFAALRARQTGEDPTGNDQLAGRVNLLNWDGNGTPAGLFPAQPERDGATSDNPGSRPDQGTAGASGGR